MPVSDLEIVALKAAFERSGLTLTQLSEKTRLSAASLGLMFNAVRTNLTNQGCWRLEKALDCAIWRSNEEFQTRQAIIRWIGFDPFLAPLEPCRRRLALRGISVPTNPLLRAGLESAVIAAYRTAQAAATKPTYKPAGKPVVTVCGIPLHEASLDTVYLMERLKVTPDDEWTPEKTRSVVFALSVPDVAIEAMSSKARDYATEAAAYIAQFTGVNLAELAARCAELLAPIFMKTQTNPRHERHN